MTLGIILAVTVGYCEVFNLDSYLLKLDRVQTVET